MSVQSSLAEIERCLAIAKQHDEKLAKGVRSSAPKLRAALLDIGKLVGESRKAALDAGKQIPVKKRAPKAAVAAAEASEDGPAAMDRRCQVCLMKDEGFRFDFFEHGNGNHLGHYRCRYTSKQGVKFHLWHTYLCFDCKMNGLFVWWGGPPNLKQVAPPKKALARSASY